jgi:putative FmdB family regulatory protein
MPIYAYRCSTCGHAQDVLQKMSDPLLTVCSACGAATYVKQVTAAGFQLKGSGWYVTDFRGDNAAKKSGEVAVGGAVAGDSAAGAKGPAGSGEAASKDSSSKDSASKKGEGAPAAATAPAAGSSAAPAASPAASAPAPSSNKPSS